MTHLAFSHNIISFCSSIVTRPPHNYLMLLLLFKIAYYSVFSHQLELVSFSASFLLCSLQNKICRLWSALWTLAFWLLSMLSYGFYLALPSIIALFKNSIFMYTYTGYSSGNLSFHIHIRYPLFNSKLVNKNHEFYFIPCTKGFS